MEQYLPAILALVGVIATVAVNLGLGLIKNKNEVKAGGDEAETAFRDDLMERLKAAKEMEDTLRARLAEKEKEGSVDRRTMQELERDVTRKDITILRQQNELDSLKQELEKFNRKVFYIREIAKEDKPVGETTDEPK